MKLHLLSSTAFVLCAAAPAYAADATNPPPAADIIVTGTRLTGMRAQDSAAPVQVIGVQALQNVGPPDLGPALSASLPSLNFQGFGNDTANLTLSAALRGISPNETLVLINGKRRHTTANLAVAGGSPYSGSATTDLSFVPVASIQRVEVLQDGAAAQYGSDAIAGVVNIITKTASHGGMLTASGGQNYENGGKTASAAINAGMKLGENGFINLTGEYKFHDFTQHGTCDRRYFDPQCNITATNPVIVAGLKASDGFPRVNRINGDARYTIYNVSFSAGYDLGSAQLYAFGSYGNRSARSNQNYRVGNRVSGTTSTGVTVYPLPNGFTPQEGVREEDFSLTAGIKGKAAGWNYDLSGTYGRDTVKLYTLNSANRGLFSALQSTSATPLTGLQRDFYDGQLSNSEWAANLDLSREFEVGFAKPVTLALGAEYRRDSYAIGEGEWAANAYGGGQGYQGFADTDAGVFSRTGYAFYADLAADPVAGLHTDLAGRYEHFSDFGSVTTGKLTARYDFSPAFALRGTVANGFRAPSLAEEHYSSVNVGPGYVYGQFPANSPSSQLLGFSPLKPERSTNLSIGIVTHLAPALQFTLDAYQISIKHRIVGSGDIFGSNGSTVVSQAVLDALSARKISVADATSYAGIDIFTNGADTRTRGVEATANYASDFGEANHVDWSLGVNYNKTEVTNIIDLPSAVYNASQGQTKLMTQYAIDALTTASPRVKAIANALWSHGPLKVNLRETMYGVTSQHLSPDGSGQGSSAQLVRIGTTFITDLDIGYALTPHLRFNAGANNLFNKQAPTMPTVTVNGTQRPLLNNIYNAAIAFTPWGINGGYYYGRVTYNF
ncbi:TonB-dependent receptor plug domain-containing protein [Novosphingobium sediminicola]|uniref:Iron complex outermembrane receptor protein n=1 Tax=Novosphingobium sediminicola TaxID=563162 RepID=A0A7W6G8K0_9SPHN|nr:TonB-dependent receptor [Novosphingobium sediminicola]MBB3957508.1 iron complex outermembrane receptor protein [Novosphingobium sediminicola]